METLLGLKHLKGLFQYFGTRPYFYITLGLLYILHQQQLINVKWRYIIFERLSVCAAVSSAYCNSSVSLSAVDCSRWSIWEDSEDVLISASLPALAVSLQRLEQLRASSKASIQHRPGETDTFQRWEGAPSLHFARTNNQQSHINLTIRLRCCSKDQVVAGQRLRDGANVLSFGTLSIWRER